MPPLLRSGECHSSHRHKTAFGGNIRGNWEGVVAAVIGLGKMYGQTAMRDVPYLLSS